MATVKLLHNPISWRFLGFIILALTCLAVISGHDNSLLPKKNSYILHAQFQSVEGLEIGSKVTLGGIEVGKITHLEINESEGYNYNIQVSFYIDDSIVLSQDASATITGNNIFGGKHLRLTQGGFPINLQAGDNILYVSSAVNFLQLLHNLITRAEGTN